MKSSPNRVAWSHWDRFLLIILGIVLALVIGLVFWFRALDKNPEVSVPTPAPPANNAYNYYKAAADALVDTSKIDWAISKLPPGQKPNGDQRDYSPAEKEALVRENAGAVEILHYGFRYPYQDPPARSFSATFPHYQKLRALARFLMLQGQVATEKGDWNGAINADLDAVQLGETMPRGGPLIGMLVGDACQAIGRRHAWDVVNHLSAAQAKAAAQRLEGIRTKHVPFADTMQDEEWQGQAGLLEVMRQHNWPGTLGNYAGSEDDGTAAILQQKTTLIRVRLMGKRNIMANYTRYMNQAIANARMPYAAHPAAPVIPNDPMSQILLPVFDKARIRETEANTQNALLLTLLALRAYKLDHSAYPAALSALAPTYLKAVPDDPFAVSGPVRYKLTGSRFVLYSVGPDGKDDGGKAILDATQPAPTDPGASDRRRYVQPESQGDIVAGVNIT